jgi:hypothetical protein
VRMIPRTSLDGNRECINSGRVEVRVVLVESGGPVRMSLSRRPAMIGYGAALTTLE